VDIDDPFLTPQENVELLKKLGTPRTAATLAKLRCTGGGPPFAKDGHFVRYRGSWTRKWVGDRLTPKQSTSGARS
jgi:hypothetical protein